jgi:hypothetical protein
MLPDSVIVAVVTGVSTLSGVGITSLIQTINTQRTQRFELRKESLQLEFKASHEQTALIREKLEKAHIILSEISREFSLTFLTIDWSAKMLPVDFHNKYRELCTKADEVQMIVDFYAPSIKESVEELYGLMNCYWGFFHVVLVMEEKGEKVDPTTPSYLESVKYSQKIPSKVYEIQTKIGKMAHSILNS